MTDKKLTDNEIIKALECCASGNDGCEKDCPLSKECDSPIKSGEKIMQSALDLINRLQAEDESLRANITALTRSISELTKEVERQRKDKEDAFQLAASIVEADKILKAEAYKECIGKIENYVKTHCNPYGKPNYDYDTSVKILNYLDNLLKEKIGE